MTGKPPAKGSWTEVLVAADGLVEMFAEDAVATSSPFHNGSRVGSSRPLLSRLSLPIILPNPHSSSTETFAPRSWDAS